jgi:hypothetical protein
MTQEGSSAETIALLIIIIVTISIVIRRQDRNDGCDRQTTQAGPKRGEVAASDNFPFGNFRASGDVRQVRYRYLSGRPPLQVYEFTL